MHNEPSVSVSRDRHFGGPKKSVTIYRNRRSHLTEMTGHALPKSAVTIGRNTHYGKATKVNTRPRPLADASLGKAKNYLPNCRWRIAHGVTRL